jgi:hypothetical protein
VIRRARALIVALAIAAPGAALAAGSGLNYLDGVLRKAADVIINPLIRGLFAAALVLFFWGVMQFIRGATDESARETGKRHMLWGIVGMAVMVSVFAVIRLATSQIGVTPDFTF